MVDVLRYEQTTHTIEHSAKLRTYSASRQTGESMKELH